MPDAAPPKPAAPAAPAPKAAGTGTGDAGPVWVMAMSPGTFQHPGQQRAFHYDRGEKFQIPGASFVRPWMRIVPGKNTPPPSRPPETTAPNQPQPAAADVVTGPPAPAGE